MSNQSTLPTPIFICKECKREFSPKRKNSHFCSDKCRDKFYREQHKEESKKWHRENCLGTTTGYIHVHKREYKGICELCDRVTWSDKRCKCGRLNLRGITKYYVSRHSEEMKVGDIF